ncbi:hypothetical protein SEPCBS57363_001617 [Sporothrix epigloea]|uniref:Velvet domain-containing protein n=1 Tax=Sporothrix epigloea TaxID=1892477 RepID=A0ABP0DBA6_9PEZI
MPRTDIKQMSINSLLSGSDSASTRSFESPPAPPASHHQMPIDATAASRPAMLSSAPPVTTSKYCIHVRQQPVAARSCGFGEGDRRVIDPPPIVQLNIVDPEATPKEIDMRLRSQLTVVHCSIWDETGEQDNSTMPEDYRQQRRLMGTLVSSPFVGRDEYGKEGCFFCFPDLSCRTPGSFRLKFSLVVLKLPGMRAGGSSPILTTTMSSIFTVYSAKDFPGMQASTNLTRCLKKQGCLISIKKGNEKTGTAHSREESEEGGEADDGASSGKSQKVAKLS